jgi:hypothetical protein
VSLSALPGLASCLDLRLPLSSIDLILLSPASARSEATMQAYLLSSKPSSPSHPPPIKAGASRPKNPSLRQAIAELLPGDGSDELVLDPLGGNLAKLNKALIGTLGREDNPITGSTAYSRTMQVQARFCRPSLMLRRY